MKYVVAILFSCILSPVFAQEKKHATNEKNPGIPVRVVEASCGQCQFGLHGKGCALAVRIDGKSYFVEGTSIDEYGDAHAKDGFCESVRKAEVQGKIVKNKFRATYFKLLPG